MSAAVAALLDHSPDLLDPFANERGRKGDAPDPINWSQDATNGISLAPPIGWQEGDPAFEPGPSAESEEWDGYNVDAINGQALIDSLKRHRECTGGIALVSAPRRRSLREHIEGVDAIVDTIDQMDEQDLTPEAVEELAGMLAGAIAGTKKKVDATNYVFAMLEAELFVNKGEEERIALRIVRIQKQIDRLTRSVLDVIKSKGLDCLEGETSTIKRRYNPAKLILDPGATFPAEFMRTPEPPPPPMPEPDNALIKAALKAERVIPGAKLVRGEKLVRS